MSINCQHHQCQLTNKNTVRYPQMACLITGSNSWLAIHKTGTRSTNKMSAKYPFCCHLVKLIGTMDSWFYLLRLKERFVTCNYYHTKIYILAILKVLLYVFTIFSTVMSNKLKLCSLSNWNWMIEMEYQMIGPITYKPLVPLPQVVIFVTVVAVVAAHHNVVFVDFVHLF